METDGARCYCDENTCRPQLLDDVTIATDVER